MEEEIIQIVITKTESGYKLVTFTRSRVQELSEVENLADVLDFITFNDQFLVRP